MSGQKNITLEGAIAVTRFGLGAQQGEIALASQNPKAWLKDQLTETVLPFPMKGLLTSQGYILEKEAFIKARRAEKSDEAKIVVSEPFNKRFRAWQNAEQITRFRYGVQTQAPFHERLTQFWSNHFSVSGRTRDVLTAAAHEREAIRPFILGSFKELAYSAILHPSMLVYLDNVRSVGPNSVFGLVGGRFRRKGLNENLAREVMELHTVTPKAKYTQSDVTEFARALTGWGVADKQALNDLGGKTYFDIKKHEPGSRRVMNKTYFSIGKKQAPAVLRNLCEHPETAKNVAYKLARHFTSDKPPSRLVKALTKKFSQTNGDLMALYKVLIDAPETWEALPQKAKTPNEMLLSTARQLGPDQVFPTSAKDVFEGFGQTAFRASTPEGWPDGNENWLGPDAVMKRIEWANKVAQKNSSFDARVFLTQGLGPRLSSKTQDVIEAAESNQQALTLALMSPEFLRR